jgi:hypothetical protein
MGWVPYQEISVLRDKLSREKIKVAHEKCSTCSGDSWLLERPDDKALYAICRLCGHVMKFAIAVASRVEGELKPLNHAGKTKITAVGDPCRHCRTPVVRREHKKPPKYKAGGYFFAWWFFCTKCKAFYMLDSAKVMFDSPGALPMQPSAPVSSYDPTQIGDGVAPW